MNEDYPYDTRLDVKHQHLEIIDFDEMVQACTHPWFNQTLTVVNDSVVRIGIIEGSYHWHKHDRDDEFFFVISGKLIIDLEQRSVELHPHQGFTVSRGVLHKTRAPQKTVILMVETKAIIPTGD